MGGVLRVSVETHEVTKNGHVALSPINESVKFTSGGVGYKLDVRGIDLLHEVLVLAA